jgi:hypothetical protein
MLQLLPIYDECLLLYLRMQKVTRNVKRLEKRGRKKNVSRERKKLNPSSSFHVDTIKHAVSSRRFIIALREGTELLKKESNANITRNKIFF